MECSAAAHAPTLLAQEWSLLQQQHEQYEKLCLSVKLLAIALCALAFLAAMQLAPQLFLLGVCWIQEAVLRTFQGRLGERLLQVEALLRQEGTPATAMQLHSTWLAARPGLGGLLLDYARQAVRPTVAFPYIFLLLLSGSGLFFTLTG